ncbi:MAG: alpha/beta hydrolase [Actinomycetota bacterium]
MAESTTGASTEPSAGAPAAPAEPWAESPVGTFRSTLRTVSYAGVADPQLQMDVRTPTRAAPGRPVIVFLHPGGYYQGDKSMWAGSARAMTSRGYVTVSVNYRLSTRPDGAWPAQRNDLFHALAWMRKHGVADFATDPSRVAVLGSSAGGHLALFAQDRPGVKAVVAWSPMVDVRNIAYGVRQETLLGRNLVRYTARCAYTTCPWRYLQSLRPAGYLNAQPTVPIFAVNSTDELIRSAPLLAYRSQVRAHGGVFDVTLVPGSAHASGQLYTAIAWAGTMTHLHRYL